MRAWIDRTNGGLSGMPADGINRPPNEGDFGTSRWGGSNVSLHQPREWAEGGIDSLWWARKSRTDAHRQVPVTEVKRTAMLQRGNANY